MISKRIFDLFFAVPGLLVISPLFILVSVWIKFDSPGPVFFRQKRVGQFGNPFRIHKFRTMRINADKHGMQITIGQDTRITNSGRFLRRYKLDELPQLIDVIRGKMSLVGPRPEVPKYVAFYPCDVRDLIFALKPGITDLASIEYRDEGTLLGKASDPEKMYREEILPIKIGYYIHYANVHNILLDFRLIIRTLRLIGD